MVEPVDVKIVPYGSANYRKMVVLRDLVLRKPLKLKFSEEDLAQEEHQIQVAAFIEDQVVGTTLLVIEEDKIKMRQVAVHPKFQNQHIGRKMALFTEDYSKRLGKSEIYCHARDVASGFYIKLGYKIEGQLFKEVGIKHFKMVKKLW